ncbi:MAG: hypothetical protein WCF28_06230 [Methanobacterium sp.]|uniref:hypothetical protein n=1 Tax=Methanobacterium sp. TaxID=2164 RepID=UPI003C76B900
MVADITTILDLVFGVIILFLGLWVYKIKQYALALYLALAFGIFAVSYLEILLGVSSSDISVIFLRVLASLVIIYALIREALVK